MILLAFQFGLQPMLNKEFAHGVPDASRVFACEMLKIALSLTMLHVESQSGPTGGWSFLSAIRVAGLPSLIYTVQNMLVQVRV